MTLPVLILAAGLSRRMGGRDKLLELIDGVPLIRRQAQTALEFGPQVYVALPPAPHPRHAALEGLPVQRIDVPDAATGMSASLRAAFAALPVNTAAALLMLGDMPEITSDDLQQVARAQAEHPSHLIWRGTTQDGKAGHPIVFDRSLFADITQLTGDTGAQSIVRAHGAQTHLVPLKGQRARIDLDTPEDWANWRISQENAG